MFMYRWPNRLPLLKIASLSSRGRGVNRGPAVQKKAPGRAWQRASLPMAKVSTKPRAQRTTRATHSSLLKHAPPVGGTVKPKYVRSLGLSANVSSLRTRGGVSGLSPTSWRKVATLAVRDRRPFASERPPLPELPGLPLALRSSGSRFASHGSGGGVVARWRRPANPSGLTSELI